MEQHQRVRKRRASGKERGQAQPSQATTSGRELRDLEFSIRGWLPGNVEGAYTEIGGKNTLYVTLIN